MNIAPSGGGDRFPAVQRNEAEMIRARDERRAIEFTLVNGAVMEGIIRWYDDDTICIADENRSEVTVYKHAILYFRSKA